MRLVSQILQAKGSQTWTVAPNATVYDALSIMAEKDIGALVVVENSDVVGIFSERDYARKVILQGKSSKNTKISEIMTENVLCVNPEQTVEKCMALMTEKRIRHIPILDNGQLVGVISIGDVVKAIITDQQTIINHLEDYIQS
jgi:CBS domain-containing protein